MSDFEKDKTAGASHLSRCNLWIKSSGDNSGLWRIAALVWVIMSTFAPMPASAETFTGSDFLRWSQDQQDSYIRISVTMAAFVATQNAGDHAECLNDWYYASRDAEDSRNAEIRANVERFPNYHPTTTILATIEKKCGSFTFSQ